MKALFVVLGLTLASVCTAGNQDGTVSDVFVRASDGLIYFVLVGDPKVASPACATFSYWIIKDENSNAGKQQYQMLLTAQATGRTVTVLGANTCTRWSDGEDVDSILLRAQP